MSNNPEHLARRRDQRSRQIATTIAVDILRESASNHRLPCITCVCSAINAIWDRDDNIDALHRRLCNECPELTRACADFLLLLRSNEQRHQLFTDAASDSSGCACDLGNPHVRNLHPAPLEHFKRPNDAPLDVLLTALLLVMSCAYSSIISTGNLTTFRTFQRARMRTTYRKRKAWPACIEDLIPYGIDQSIDSLSGWQGYCSGVIIMSVARSLFFASAYPAFPSIPICKIFLRVSYPLLDRTATIRANRPSQNSFLALIKEHRLIFTYITYLHEDCISLLARQSNAHAELGNLVTLLVYCGQKVVDIISAEERRRGLPPGNSHDQQYDDNAALSTCTVRIWSALGSVPNPHTSILTTLIEACLSGPCSTVDKLAALATFIWNGHLCAHKSCTRTPVSEGRALLVCAGCKHIRYCSRHCQRSAWSDELAPHKEICMQLGRLARRVCLRFSYNLVEVENMDLFREQCEGAGLEDDELQSIADYCLVVYSR